MQAHILAVMESWPLQLLVVAGGRRGVVALSETADITAHGRPVGPGQLQAGQWVELDIASPDETRPVRTVRILSP